MGYDWNMNGLLVGTLQETLIDPTFNGNFRNRFIRGTYHIYGLFFRPKFQGISPENMAKKYGTNVPLF